MDNQEKRAIRREWINYYIQKSFFRVQAGKPAYTLTQIKTLVRLFESQNQEKE